MDFLTTLNALNGNKIVWGVSMIILNMGSKYVIGDLGKTHELLMKNELFKKIILMAMFFVATRDVIISFLLTVLYIIVVDGILHEKRNFAVIKPADTKPKEDTFKPTTYENYINTLNMLY
jgi:hypothetical protein